MFVPPIDRTDSTNTSALSSKSNKVVDVDVLHLPKASTDGESAAKTWVFSKYDINLPLQYEPLTPTAL